MEPAVHRPDRDMRVMMVRRAAHDRIEPFVIPKVSLTGASNERVDTRVLQVIYRIKAGPGVRLYPGQQMDLYLGNATLAPRPE